jgi:sarcosine oxidase delta subunit
MYDIENLKCPVCNQYSDFEVRRWSTFVTCPKCNADLEDEFDMIVDEDNDYEEYDLHELKVISE